jgi:hypothetical protein
MAEDDCPDGERKKEGAYAEGQTKDGLRAGSGRPLHGWDWYRSSPRNRGSACPAKLVLVIDAAATSTEPAHSFLPGCSTKFARNILFAILGVNALN